ncbi:unnamed protein product [Rhizoctonia solani]|uniref:Uncharacterized protein n=1 Tax=Rhizoctonia solani TaxID=456999 RepID=A0A8H3BGW4_9AGAM|nr:unnamed protein product [Rhizoctonia solani]
MSIVSPLSPSTWPKLQIPIPKDGMTDNIEAVLVLQAGVNADGPGLRIGTQGPGLMIIGLVVNHQGERRRADLDLGPLDAIEIGPILDQDQDLLVGTAQGLVPGTSAGAHNRRRRRKRQDKEERRRDKKDKKREKRERKDKKKHKGKSGAVTGQWGQYGIINESHMYEKDAEFRTWLVEECKMNPESLSKDATKKQFARFIEDYNTATLPHPKFYNMETYERQMNSLRNGMTADVISQSYDPNADLAAHTSRHKRPVAEAETYLSREQLQELRKVQNERTQAGQMKLLGMDIKGTMGVRMDGTEFE